MRIISDEALSSRKCMLRTFRGLPLRRGFGYQRPRRGRSSEVERQLPKLNVRGSIPLARSSREFPGGTKPAFCRHSCSCVPQQEARPMERECFLRGLGPFRLRQRNASTFSTCSFDIQSRGRIKFTQSFICTIVGGWGRPVCKGHGHPSPCAGLVYFLRLVQGDVSSQNLSIAPLMHFLLRDPPTWMPEATN